MAQELLDEEAWSASDVSVTAEPRQPALPPAAAAAAADPRRRQQQHQWDQEEQQQLQQRDQGQAEQLQTVSEASSELLDVNLKLADDDIDSYSGVRRLKLMALVAQLLADATGSGVAAAALDTAALLPLAVRLAAKLTEIVSAALEAKTQCQLVCQYQLAYGCSRDVHEELMCQLVDEDTRAAAAAQVGIQGD